MNLEETGFCWKCGRSITKGLFCPGRKCKELYQRGQERQIRRGKREGYGLAGSMH